jgi:hypothetical protein
VSESAVSGVLVRVVCGIHDRTMGVLRDRPNGVRQYRTNNVGIYAKNRKLIGPGDNTGWNFFEDSDYDRDIEAWCRECGEAPRMVHASEFLAALEGRRSHRIVI